MVVEITVKKNITANVQRIQRTKESHLQYDFYS